MGKDCVTQRGKRQPSNHRNLNRRHDFVRFRGKSTESQNAAGVGQGSGRNTALSGILAKRWVTPVLWPHALGLPDLRAGLGHMDQTLVDGLFHRGGATGRVKLLKQTLDVDLYRSFGNSKFVADGFIALAFSDES